MTTIWRRLGLGKACESCDGRWGTRVELRLQWIWRSSWSQRKRVEFYHRGCAVNLLFGDWVFMKALWYCLESSDVTGRVGMERWQIFLYMLIISESISDKHFYKHVETSYIWKVITQDDNHTSVLFISA